MAWGAIIGAGVGLVGSVVAGNSANKAAQQSADASAETAQKQIDFAKQNQARAEGIWAPEVNRGNWADAAQAAQWGAPSDFSSYGAYQPSNAAQGASSSTPDLRAYWRAHSKTLSDGWNALTPQQRAQYGGDTKEAQFKYAQAQYNAPGGGKAQGWSMPTATSPPASVTRDQTDAAITGNWQYRQGDQNYTDANTEAGRAYGEERNLNQYEFNAMSRMNSAERDRFLNMSQAERDKMLGLNSQDYAARTGFTDKAIADRSELNDIYQGQNTDRIASSLGVTGQVGKLARAGQERANQLDLEFADTARGWRNEDYTPYATGRTSAWGDYYDNNRDAYGNYYDNSRTAQSNLSGANRSAMQTKNATRQGNMSTRNAVRSGVYGDYNQYLASLAANKQNALGQITNAGNTATQTAINATGNAGQAASNAYLQQGRNNADMWSSVAGFGGEIAGSVLGNKKKQPNYYSSYG